jgi:hypothetical protein
VLLTTKKKGTFVVRFSSDPGSFTITTKGKDDLTHYRIKHKAGQPFVLNNNEFSSLDAVLKQHKKKLNLKYPCKGSKYPALLKEMSTVQSVPLYEEK